MTYEIEDSLVSTEDRECGGSRTEGDPYAVLPRSPWGVPIENFMICHPIPIDLKAMNFNAQGVNIIQDREGVHHILDLVGVSHYEVPDFIEEGLSGTGKGGFSRKIPKNQLKAAMPLLTPGKSLIYLASMHAIIKNPNELYKDYLYGTRWAMECPKEHAEHSDPLIYNQLIEELAFEGKEHESCLGLLWQCLLPRKQDISPVESRFFVRKQANGANFPVARPPEGFVPEWETGIFMAFHPSFEIVYDPVDGNHEKSAEVLQDTEWTWHVTRS